MKVLVGLSTGEHIRRAEFLPSFLALERPDGSLMATVHGQSPATSRNIIIDQAIETGCTHILFVDDDMILQTDTLTKLLSHDKDIVSALYLLRSFPHYPAFFDEAYETGDCKFSFLNDYKNERLVKGVNCGLGCVLIKTSIFSHLEKPYVRLGEIKKDGWCDDVGFFNRCRKAGFEIYCDLEATVGHMHGITIWPKKVDNLWLTRYAVNNGNVEFAQHKPTDKEIEEQKKEKLLLV